MTERPETLIGEARVVVVDLALLQANGPDGIRKAGGPGGQLVARLHSDPGDPESAVRAERVVERARQPAHGTHREEPLRPAHHLDGCPVRHQYTAGRFWLASSTSKLS